MSGVMSMFRSAFGGNNQQQTPPAPPGDGNPANPGSTAGANPTIPNGSTPQSNGTPPAIPAAGTGEKSPMEKFADVWKSDPKQPTEAPNLAPTINLDPAKLMEAAKNVSFVSHIADDRIQKAMTDPTEFKNLLNEVAQVGFVQATVASGKLVENSLGSAQQVLNDKVLPAAFRQQAVQQALANNPVFSNPAVAPMLDMVKQQLMTKYPTATPEAIAAQAAEYVNSMAQLVVTSTGGQIVNPQQQQQGRGFTRNEPDWEKWAQG